MNRFAVFVAIICVLLGLGMHWQIIPNIGVQGMTAGIALLALAILYSPPKKKEDFDSLFAEIDKYQENPKKY